VKKKKVVQARRARAALIPYSLTSDHWHSKVREEEQKYERKKRKREGGKTSDFRSSYLWHPKLLSGCVRGRKKGKGNSEGGKREGKGGAYDGFSSIPVFQGLKGGKKETEKRQKKSQPCRIMYYNLKFLFFAMRLTDPRGEGKLGKRKKGGGVAQLSKFSPPLSTLPHFG